MASHDSFDSSEEMALYGPAQHETESNTSEPLYGPPQHETVTVPNPCSGSELARPTVVADFDGADFDGTDPVDRRNRSARNASTTD
ncbi:hypothetical protein [Haloprofundus sp. MHR1]|uniref:hypothetical protein n=1 Tax=Haloprofundus sp. MHR1 TaxID=2572921 RepID=UPI0010BE7F75|nr:hypothetical protein [Haloprofundus sp. MHR1]QCJ46809.1 hypothetical protein FCF25_06655 [Haloprofundus sp. MHR1]